MIFFLQLYVSFESVIVLLQSFAQHPVCSSGSSGFPFSTGKTVNEVEFGG